MHSLEALVILDQGPYSFPDLALPTLPTLLPSCLLVPLRSLRAGHSPPSSPTQATTLTIPDCTASMKASGASAHPTPPLCSQNTQH